MTVTIETLTISSLRAQPLGYEEYDAMSGRVARRWSVEGLVKPSEWLSLLNIFETWKAARLQDSDTLLTLTTGSTVSFSGSALGYSWSGTPCWFNAAPQAEVVGGYVGVSFVLVDANQYLTALIREQEISVEVADSDRANGTYSLGTTVLTLLEQPDGYAAGPQLERAASGATFVQGPYRAVRSKRINGYTTESGWSDIRTWYEAIALTAPSKGDFYPAGPPTMQREVLITAGVRSTRCVVSIELVEVT